MLNAQRIFNRGIEDARQMLALYDYLIRQVQGPVSYEDVLRFQIVYSVSTFDKLIHDLIRIGMVQIFLGKRAATSKYKSEEISLDLHAALLSATFPPREILFEQEIARKFKSQSFQDTSKIADGLSYIWQEPHKWHAISKSMGWKHDEVKKKFKLVVGRRNAVVHEADLDPVSGTKNPITADECDDITKFIELCGNTIVKLVLDP